VRAKRTLAAAQIPFEVPRGDELAARLSSVLEVIYLVFNEGYSATAGDDWMRPTLCEEALRLGRILAELAPKEPEVHSLVALMEIQASRSKARTSRSGEPILLLDQNRALWDQLLIRRGLAALERAAGAPVPTPPSIHRRLSRPRAHRGRNRLGAHRRALQRSRATHAFTRRRSESCRRLWHGLRSRAGLALVDTLTSDPVLESYHLLPSVRGDLLAKLDRLDEARVEFERAASLTRNSRERALLLERARACTG